MKTNLPPLSPTNLTTKDQAYAASIQFSSVPNAKEINGIVCHTVANICAEETITDNPMIFLLAKGIQKDSINIVL